MRILSINRLEETKDYSYTRIEFRTWYGKEFCKTCISPISNIHTIYADNGNDITQSLWGVVRAFLQTTENYHSYK